MCGVCVPYTAVIPLLILGLKWILDKFVFLWRPFFPKSMTMTTTSTTQEQQQQRRRPKPRRKATTKAVRLQQEEEEEKNDDGYCPCCVEGDDNDQEEEEEKENIPNNKSNPIMMTNYCTFITTTTDSTSSTSSSASSSSSSSKFGMIQTIESEESWNTLVKESSVIIVKMTASWCQPCKAIQPHFARMVAEVQTNNKNKKNNNKTCTPSTNPNLTFGYAIVDVDDLDSVAGRYKVAALPTFLAIETQGKTVVQRYTGSTETELQTFFTQVQEYMNQSSSSS